MHAKPFVLTCDAAFDAAAGDALPTRISGIAYSGGAVMSGMAVIDLASTKVALPAPLLSGHDRDEVIGMLNTGANSGAELSIAGDLYSDIDDTARSIAAKAKRGHRWQLSVGVFGMNFEDISPGNSVTVNGREFKGPITVLRGGTVREVSVVALGSDAETNAAFFSARGATNHPGDPSMTIEQLQAQVAALTAQVAELTAARDRAKTDLDARDAKIVELTAAADQARRDARATEVKSLFAEIGQSFTEEAAAPYMDLPAATFTAISAQLKARPALPEHLRQQASGGTQAPAGGGSVLLSAVKSAHGLN